MYSRCAAPRCAARWKHMIKEVCRGRLHLCVQHNRAQVETYACHSHHHLTQQRQWHNPWLDRVYNILGCDTAQGYVLVHNSFAFTLARKNWPPNYIIQMRSALKFLYPPPPKKKVYKTTAQQGELIFIWHWYCSEYCACFKHCSVSLEPSSAAALLAFSITLPVPVLSSSLSVFRLCRN